MDMIDLYRLIEREYETSFFLESLGGNSYDSRYAVIGFNPVHIFEGKGNQLIINGIPREVENPYYSLREFLPTDVLSVNYAGGLVGYLGYESMNYFEPELKLPEHNSFPPFLFGFYEDGIIHDKFTGTTVYFYYNENRLGTIQKLIASGSIAEGDFFARSLGRTRSVEEHGEMVEKTIQEIKSGNTFQCQIGFQEDFEISGDTLKFYNVLREINPSPHMLYLKFPGDRKIIGASPELLFRLRNGEMESFPLAGTTRRGKTPDEDMELVKILLNDPKEIAEHNMLIDLHRNDIGRVAKFGSVKVRRRFDIKKFSHVQHISSEVVGLIRPDEDMFSGLASSFPAGTLSGAPKIESMKIIERIEKSPRGPYGGAVGHFGVNGDCIFAIPIRTLFVTGNRAYARASGGIVYDSTAENEYREIENKLASVLNALKKASGK